MNDILLGKGEGAGEVHLLARYGNRHGLIAGATGTGKSVTLMTLAEGWSRLGVPVFLADVKGDLAGLCQPATPGGKVGERVAKLGLADWSPQANPVVFWDIHGKKGHPVRTTVSEMGPTLLARVLDVNDVQEGVLQVAFKVADDNGLLLLDLDDLRAMLAFVSEQAKEISAQYGLVSTQSVAAIQRALLRLEQDGGQQFFAEPALDLADFMRQDMSGRGIINVLAADNLILKPKLYSTFLLWMLSELFENLPEVGDLAQPRLVFCFDEAHLLFDDAPSSLLDRIEQVVRLIRSKGVGVYFCSQLPADVPDEVLGQLGNRVQHALRAFTPRDQKSVRVAAETFPVNPAVDVVAAITQLAVGEALVTTLQDDGIPLPVQRVYILPPRCRIGTITDDERATIRARSPIGTRYDVEVDRESAFEVLRAKKEAAKRGTPTTRPAPAADAPTPLPAEAATREPASARAPVTPPTEEGGFGQTVKDWLFGSRRRQGAIEAATKSAARTVGSQLGRQILRGVLGGIKR